MMTLMEIYKLKKDEAFTKMNSFLALSCMKNIYPEYIEEVKIFFM